MCTVRIMVMFWFYERYSSREAWLAPTSIKHGEPMRILTQAAYPSSSYRQKRYITETDKSASLPQISSSYTMICEDSSSENVSLQQNEIEVELEGHI